MKSNEEIRDEVLWQIWGQSYNDDMKLYDEIKAIDLAIKLKGEAGRQEFNDDCMGKGKGNPIYDAFEAGKEEGRKSVLRAGHEHHYEPCEWCQAQGEGFRKIGWNAALDAVEKIVLEHLQHRDIFHTITRNGESFDKCTCLDVIVNEFAHLRRG